MNAQVKQQVVRWTRLALFGGLAATPSGQAIARDLHQLATDAHVALLGPAFWQGTIIGAAEVLTRSVWPTLATGSSRPVYGVLGSVAAKLLGVEAPAKPNVTPVPR